MVLAAYRDFTAGTIHIKPVYVRDQVTNMARVVDCITANTERHIPVVVDGASAAAVAPFTRRDMTISVLIYFRRA